MRSMCLCRCTTTTPDRDPILNRAREQTQDVEVTTTSVHDRSYTRTGCKRQHLKGNPGAISRPPQQGRTGLSTKHGHTDTTPLLDAEARSRVPGTAHPPAP